MTLSPAPTARPSVAARARGWGPSPQRAVSIAYVIALLMTAVDMQIVNVALPTLSRAFSAPITDVQWTVIAYLLTLAVVIPASGWIGDRIGTKRTFLFALALFTFASALCGAADSLPELIAARALQGIGGGMLTPTGTAMLYRAYGPEQRARVARTLILPILIGPGAAPILGGVLTQTLSWRWVFLINVPIGVVMLAFAYRYLPEHRAAPSGRLDLRGMLLSGLGLSALLYAISEGSVLGWSAPQILVPGIGGIALLWVFARGALRAPDPILRVRLLREPLLRATNIVFVLTTGVFLASLYLTPIFLQQVLHQSPIGSGTTTFVEVIGVGVGSQTLGRLYPRLGPRVLTGVGAIALTAYMALFLLVSPGVNMWLVRALMFFGGLGNAGAFLSIQTSMFTHISSEDTGHASAIYNTVRQSAIALDIAVLTTVVAGAGGSVLAAFHAAYLTGAILCAVGCVLAWTLIKTDAARSTMGRPSEPAQRDRAAAAEFRGD
ncbi:MAG: DHA2 family efflux MFS transporter permease subunit [Solirubrobacteraceae bacterium]